ncbi:MAG: zinc ribbon domain-containing protein [Alphaproteobacteria bacterium]|nr:zinc ribbon domain-containing protein [Alphaproteobacteria bacterium]
MELSPGQARAQACPECGWPLLVCQRGHANRPESRFCTRCLTDAALPEEGYWGALEGDSSPRSALILKGLDPAVLPLEPPDGQGRLPVLGALGSYLALSRPAERVTRLVPFGYRERASLDLPLDLSEATALYHDRGQLVWEGRTSGVHRFDVPWDAIDACFEGAPLSDDALALTPSQGRRFTLLSDGKGPRLEPLHDPLLPRGSDAPEADLSVLWQGAEARAVGPWLLRLVRGVEPRAEVIGGFRLDALYHQPVLRHGRVYGIGRGEALGGPDVRAFCVPVDRMRPEGGFRA